MFKDGSLLFPGRRSGCSSSELPTRSILVDDISLLMESVLLEKEIGETRLSD